MPFYVQKGKDWARLHVHIPTDIRDDRGELLVSIDPADPDDAEKVYVEVPWHVNVLVTTERRDRIFPGQREVVNRDNIFIRNLVTGEMFAIIHSEKPIIDRRKR
jgi:hypothetical protein